MINILTIVGICQKGSYCAYEHDREHIRVCVPYLNDRCVKRHCLLSHTNNEFNTPVCSYFLQSKCSNSHCKYSHSFPDEFGQDTEVWVCRQFAIGGWCERGKKCPFLHLLECPDFEEDGICPRKQACPLAHSVTLRTQKLMSVPKNKYQRPDDDVTIDSDEETKVVSSYTVDPERLFVGKEEQYDAYIDVKPQESEFLIHLDSSDSDDELEEINDFVGISQGTEVGAR